MTRPSWDDQFAESESERNERLRAKRLKRTKALVEPTCQRCGRVHIPIGQFLEGKLTCGRCS